MFSSNEMKCGNRRVGENHSTSCGAAVRAKPKASLRALGSHPLLIGAAEQRLKLFALIFRWLQIRLNRRSAARNKFRSLPKARRLALGLVLTAAPQLVELLLRVLDF